MDRDEFDREDTPAPPRAPGAPGEGVRIIGAEEAAAAVEAGHATGKRPEDMPRYGDVPPSPQGPRPSTRFPLPDSVDPTKVVPRGQSGKIRFPLPDERNEDEPTTGAPALPHWTEPPTGQVPKILAGQPDEPEDDAAWQGFAAQAPRWRGEQASDWEEADFDDVAALADDEVRMGALDSTRSEESDIFSFDEPEPEPIEEPVYEPAARAAGPQPMRRIRSRQPAPPVQDFDDLVGGPGSATPTGERNLPLAVGTGLAIAGAALFLAKLGPGWFMVLVTAVVLLSAIEVFDVFRRSGYKPALPLVLVATGALVVGSYTKGERAIPLIMALTVVFTFLWYLSGTVTARPTVNLGVTLLGFMWVGFLGSFAGLLLRYPERQGVAFMVGAIVATVANDVGALFAGRRFGSSPLAPTISPNKSWEGFAGGALASVTVSVIVLAFVPGMSPWTAGSAFALGLVVSVVAPLGDLCESMIKRDLGIKDMGTMLPGHGGVADRFDAVLFVLPAVYYLVELLNVGLAG